MATIKASALFLFAMPVFAGVVQTASCTIGPIPGPPLASSTGTDSCSITASFTDILGNVSAFAQARSTAGFFSIGAFTRAGSPETACQSCANPILARSSASVTETYYVSTFGPQRQGFMVAHPLGDSGGIFDVIGQATGVGGISAPNFSVSA